MKPKLFSTRLLEFRKQAKMSQVTLAEEANVTQAQVSELETGKYLPSLPTLQKLAKALGVGLDDLAGEGEGK